MKKLKGRIVDDYGQVIFDENGIMEMLYHNKPLNNVVVDNIETIFQYSEQQLERGLDIPFDVYEKPSKTIEEWDDNRRNNWLIPDEFKNLDLKEYLLNKCTSNIEKDRVIHELKLFEERNMFDLLRTIIWMVECWRRDKVVWGVGRGSSVASYCLFLIGIHRVNSLQYNLDIEEFLK